VRARADQQRDPACPGRSGSGTTVSGAGPVGRGVGTGTSIGVPPVPGVAGAPGPCPIPEGVYFATGRGFPSGPMTPARSLFGSL
jgi:hypothetical protein